MIQRIGCAAVAVLVASLTGPALAEWKVLPPSDQRQPRPEAVPPGAADIKPGDPWPNDDKYRWMIGELTIPERIDEQPVAGKPVALQFNCGDGGEVHVDGRLESRYDNDHPALVLLAEQAQPGRKVRVDVQVYAKAQGGDSFGEARLVVVDARRALQPLALTVRPGRVTGPVPDGIIGLSQGGGMSDYEPATARKLREGGFRWFRMDNVLTGTVKKSENGELVYDFTDLDKRVDFIHAVGADPILAASYMPQVFDAVPDHNRQSAPRDYALWEDLCYRAARRCLERGRRVPFWEVWNEPNTGWIKPGPDDAGKEAFTALYRKAVGRDDVKPETVRTFEAYARLYRATARGVLRADPQAKIGGPALASGPFEEGPGVNGKGFARGLMLWCEQEKLPLHFLSWHEYFQESSMIAREADTFRAYLRDFPDLEKQVESLMITEWNEAWWANRPMDHEIGAAWCADGVVRAIIPHRIRRPCFFYVKQNDMNFRGDFSLLMKDNLPKPSYHVASIFNHLTGNWVEIGGADGEICGVAAWDAAKTRLAVVLVNYQFRYGLRRRVRLSIAALPTGLRGGGWREFLVDAAHSNVWHDAGQAVLFKGREGTAAGPAFTYEATMPANSIRLLEITR
ncbi:MAG: hypothetical protein HRF43_02225 [Phycisphaerae bacterium]|jgi:hypothetical protein